MNLLSTTVISTPVAEIAFTGILPNKRYLLVGCDVSSSLADTIYGVLCMQLYNSGVRLVTSGTLRLGQTYIVSIINNFYQSVAPTDPRDQIEISSAINDKGNFIMEFFTGAYTDNFVTGECFAVTRYNKPGTTAADFHGTTSQFNIQQTFDEFRLKMLVTGDLTGGEFLLFMGDGFPS